MIESELYHYGTPRHSGRFPYGSGENPFQHPYQHVDNFPKGDLKTVYAEYKRLKSEGKTEQEICKEWGVSSTYLRTKVSAAKESEMLERNDKIIKLKEHGYSNSEIGRQLGINESLVRSAIAQHEEGKVGAAKATADFLEQKVNELGPIDIGAGVEKYPDIGVKRTKFDTAVQMLVDKGYEKHNIKVEQATNKGKFTTVEVLAPPGTEWKDLYFNLDSIHTLNSYSEDNGETFKDVIYPRPIDISRVKVRSAEEGGKDRDGLIEVRRGVDDVSLGTSKYAQARILVGENLYLKGMAVYGDDKDFPPGVDIIFNSNKSKDLPITDHLKPTKDDKDNPFGALIKANGQTHYIDENGKDQISVVNKVREEGDWDEYSKNLSSQFLSKQSLPLIKSQLNLAKLEKEDEYNDIIKIKNDTIRQSLLISFADDCDGAAETLKAAALPRQATKVLIPLETLKDNECYAPSYRDGEQLCLVRYPHEGVFQIPIVTVNNSNRQGKKMLGNDIQDAIGINQKTAQQLSGADFDGDTVIAIPINEKVKIKTSDILEGLKDFDPSERYPYVEGCKLITTDKQKQQEMGRVSNLITDMTLKGASPEEITRATRHSMTVIDAKKHKLNYMKSEEENGIAALKKKYQGGANRGASTLISKASSEQRVDERKYSKIDPETGEKIWINSNRTYIKQIKDDDGNIISEKEYKYQTKSTKMAETKDAYELTSGGSKENPGTKTEALYAEYANSMKALANKCRKEAYYIKPIETKPEKKQLYFNEINSLDAKLNKALMNAPKERAAQVKAAASVQKKKKYYKEKGEEYSKNDITKEGQRALQSARIGYGAKMGGEKGASIKITPKEWEAINSGAISSNKIKKILLYSDMDTIKEYALPKDTNYISDAKKSRIKAMLDRGFTLQDIADQVGVSTSTVSSISKGSR